MSGSSGYLSCLLQTLLFGHTNISRGHVFWYSNFKMTFQNIAETFIHMLFQNINRLIETIYIYIYFKGKIKRYCSMVIGTRPTFLSQILGLAKIIVLNCNYSHGCITILEIMKNCRQMGLIRP
jgi:hypothetical protein